LCIQFYQDLLFSSEETHESCDKDIFKAKGLKPPETWDDFIKVAEAVMERDKGGRITRYSLSLPGMGLFVNIAVGELTKANGGRLFDLKTGQPTFTEKQVIEVLDFYKRLRRIYRKVPIRRLQGGLCVSLGPFFSAFLYKNRLNLQP
jgi:hypothetical protein